MTNPLRKTTKLGLELKPIVKTPFFQINQPRGKKSIHQHDPCHIFLAENQSLKFDGQL